MLDSIHTHIDYVFKLLFMARTGTSTSYLTYTRLRAQAHSYSLSRCPSLSRSHSPIDMSCYEQTDTSHCAKAQKRAQHECTTFPGKRENKALFSFDFRNEIHTRMTYRFSSLMVILLFIYCWIDMSCQPLELVYDIIHTQTHILYSLNKG